MSTEEEPTKKRFTCPHCNNNVTAPPEDVVDPVECPHCGQTGQFTPAQPKREGGGESPSPEEKEPAPVLDEVDASADAIGASEFTGRETAKPAGDSTPKIHARKAPPRQKKKKSITPPRRAGGSGDGAPRPGYRRHTPAAAPATKEGISLMTVFLAIVAAVLAVIIVMIMIPRNLTAIQGYPAKSIGGSEPRNLLAEVQEILGPRDRSISFSEAEVNAYLNHRIQGIQRGPMKGMVKFKGAYADFEKEKVELFIERTVIGIPFTMSLKVSKAKFEHKTNWRAGGGSIGTFKMSSRQFKPIVDAFSRLGAACEEEMDAIQRMGDIRFENDKVVLDPGFGGQRTPEKPAESVPAPAESPATPEGETPAPADPAMEGEAMEGDREGAAPPAPPGNMEAADPGDAVDDGAR